MLICRAERIFIDIYCCLPHGFVAKPVNAFLISGMLSSINRIRKSSVTPVHICEKSFSIKDSVHGLMVCSYVTQRRHIHKNVRIQRTVNSINIVSILLPLTERDLWRRFVLAEQQLRSKNLLNFLECGTNFGTDKD